MRKARRILEEILSNDEYNAFLDFLREVYAGIKGSGLTAYEQKHILDCFEPSAIQYWWNIFNGGSDEE